MATANQAAKVLNDLSHLFCKEDNLAYEEVLTDYFLNDDDGQDDNDDDGQDDDGQDDNDDDGQDDYHRESFTECKF